MGVTPELWRLAEDQRALLTVAQMDEAGVVASTRHSWVARGRMERCHANVYAICGVGWTWQRRAMAAVLGAGPGAALSHRSSAYVWEQLEEEPPVEVSILRGRVVSLDGVIVHRTRDEFAVHHRDGLPVTSPMRTVLDLGAVVPDWMVDRALDAGLVKKLYTIAGVEWQLVELARKGRRGCGALRRVLDARALGRDRPDGMLEPRFARLRVRAGLPEPVYQHRIGGYRVDFAYPALKIAIEIDDYWSHGTHEAFERDRERRNALTLQGWTILHFTWKDIVTRPEYVARVVASAIGQA